MKTLVLFATCILATTIVGDAQIISNILNTITSKVFDIKELIDFHVILAECTIKLGILSKVGETPEMSFCIAEKKHLLDSEGGILWPEADIYIEKVIRNPNKMYVIKKWVEICKEEGEKVQGSKYEKTMKVMECGLPIAKYIAEQKV